MDRKRPPGKGGRGGDDRTGSGGDDGPRVAQRKQREAAALRANLAKRKAQKRGRATSDEPS